MIALFPIEHSTVCWETLVDEFRGSKIGKCSVGWLVPAVPFSAIFNSF